MRRNDAYVAGGILATALLVRVILVIVWNSFEPMTDGLHFDHLATRLADGDGWGPAGFPAASGPTAYRAPGYPGLLSLVYLVVGGHSWKAAQLLNALLGTGIVALIGAIGGMLFSRPVAFVAMSIAAVHPLLIMVGAPIVLEPLLVFLVLAGVAATLWHRRRPGQLRWPIVAGAALGLSILTRELGALALPPLMLLAYQTKRGDDRADAAARALVAPAAMLVASIAVMLPWTVRNLIVFDTFIPVSNSAGVGLSGTFNETARTNDEHPGRWIVPWQDPAMTEIILSRPDWREDELSAALTEASLEVLAEHPQYLLRLGYWNTVRMFDLDGGDYSRYTAQFVPYPEPIVAPAVVGGWLVAALAVAGAFTRRVRQVPSAIWAIPAIMIPFMVFVLPGSIRYRASVEPFLVLLASVAIVTGAERLRASRHGAARSTGV